MNTYEKRLNSLGNSSAEIAAQLRELGITGPRYSETECPIATYLMGLDGIDDVIIRPAGYRAGEVLIWADGHLWPIGVSISPAVNAFIADFDGAKYPELEEGR